MAIVNIRRKQESWLDPFKEKENAIAALREMIDQDNTITRGGMYCLEIINQLIQTENREKNKKNLFERIPPKYFGGLPGGGRRNVQASAILRAEIETDRRKPSKILPSGYTREQELIGNWAERDGCWSDYAESELIRQGQKKLSFGSEAHVFSNDKIRVYKTVDLSHCLTLQKALDRITLHNHIFPETEIRVEGFGMRDDAEDNTGFVIVVSQPFVKGKNTLGPESGPVIEKQLHKRTFSLVRPTATARERREAKEKGLPVPEFAQTAWCFTDADRSVLLYDIHDENYVFSPSGKILVFDCEIKLNDSERLGGPYPIPALDFEKESVEEICKTIAGLVPEEITLDRLFIFENFQNARTILSDLDAYGMTVTPAITLTGEEAVLQRDPRNPDKILMSDPRKVGMMLETHNQLIDGGKTISAAQMKKLSKGIPVRVDNDILYFDIDKGRINTLRKGNKLYLSPKYQVKETRINMPKP